MEGLKIISCEYIILIHNIFLISGQNQGQSIIESFLLDL